MKDESKKPDKAKSTEDIDTNIDRRNYSFENDDLKIQALATNYIIDKDGTNIYLKGAHVENSPKIPLIILHDFGEHSGIYRDLIKMISESGHSCYSFDMRGHGRSGNLLGHIPSFSELIKDLLQIAAYVKYKENGVSPILVCQGMSANVGIHFHSLHYKFSGGLVLISPTTKLRYEPSKFKRDLIRKISEVWPTFKLPSNLQPRFVDLKGVQESITTQQKQQLNYMRFSANLVNELLNHIEKSEDLLKAFLNKQVVLLPKESPVCDFSSYDDASIMLKHHVETLNECDHHSILNNSPFIVRKILDIIKQLFEVKQ